MYKFIYIKDPDNKFDNTDITFEVDASCLSDIQEAFNSFIVACGFIIKDEDNDL